MPKLYKRIWTEVARRAKVQSTLVTEATAESVRSRFFRDFHGCRADLTSYRHFDGVRSYYQSDLEAVIGEFKRREQRNPGYLIETADRVVAYYRQIRKWVDAHVLPDYRAFSNQELAELFWDYYHRTFYLAIAYDYIFANEFLPDEIVVEIAKKVPSLEKQTDYLNTLFSLDKMTEIKEEKIDLYKIGNLLLKLRNINHPKIKKAVHQHWSKYKHLNRYYYLNQDFTLAEIRKKVVISSKKVMEGDKVESPASISAKSKRIIKKLRLSPTLTKKIYAVKALGYASNIFDEFFAYEISRIDPLLKIIAAKLKLTRTELVMARGKEIVAALAGRPPANFKQELRSRYKDYALILENGKISILTGKKLAVYRRKVEQNQKFGRGIKQVSGQGASTGKARGVIKYIRDSADMKKMKKGNILLAPATYPALVPAMEKAAAIVTDEGGLLSHAAIVSRELGVPCVVGTKIGTKVFKDGDMVEVDADRGTVKLIK